jgi:hypothetical protein
MDLDSADTDSDGDMDINDGYVVMADGDIERGEEQRDKRDRLISSYLQDEIAISVKVDMNRETEIVRSVLILCKLNAVK